MSAVKAGFVQRNQWRLIVGGVILLLLAVLGWQWYQQHFPSWNEEVQLSDGRMIIVHRAHKFNTEHALIETSLTFDLPEMGGKQTWREFLYPAIVDVYQGKVYVIGNAISFAQRSAYFSPRYSYVAFSFSNGTWIRIPFDTVPQTARMRENIVWCDSRGEMKIWAFKTTGWCDRAAKFEIGYARLVDLEFQRKAALKAAEIDGHKDTASE
jgi:hypothetical protein